LRNGRVVLVDTGETAGVKIPPAAVMAGNVLAFHVRYFNGNIWVESWNSSSLPPGTPAQTVADADAREADANEIFAKIFRQRFHAVITPHQPTSPRTARLK